MKFKLEINMDNAAFEEVGDPRTELIRVLVRTIGIIESSHRGLGRMADDSGCLGVLDSNGNTVGSWKITGKRAKA